eukprot:4522575-Pleurochrysis_carterae.AAC.3
MRPSAWRLSARVAAPAARPRAALAQRRRPPSSRLRASSVAGHRPPTSSPPQSHHPARRCAATASTRSDSACSGTRPAIAGACLERAPPPYDHPATAAAAVATAAAARVTDAAQSEKLLQPADLSLERADLLCHCAHLRQLGVNVDCWRVGDGARACGVAQCRGVLIDVRVRRRNACNHERVARAAERVLQQPSQRRVAVRYVRCALQLALLTVAQCEDHLKWDTKHQIDGNTRTAWQIACRLACKHDNSGCIAATSPQAWMPAIADSRASTLCSLCVRASLSFVACHGLGNRSHSKTRSSLTFRSVKSDLLISTESCIAARPPSMSADCLSEPARSTKVSLPSATTLSVVPRSSCCTVSVKRQCEREEAAFIRVSAMRLWRTPPSKSESAWSASAASSTKRFST